MEKEDYKHRFYEGYVSKHWRHWENISPKSYDHLTKVFKRGFADFLPQDKSSAILDIGCGCGHFLYFLAKQGYSNIKGIEIGEEQIKIAHQMGVKNIERVDFFEYLPKHQNEFSLIMASQILEHLEKEEALRALDLIYQALVLDGKVIVMTPNVASFSGIMSTFGDYTHEQIFTSASLPQLL